MISKAIKCGLNDIVTVFKINKCCKCVRLYECVRLCECVFTQTSV